MAINKGLFYSRPYESPYSMWRRFISANPQLTKEELLEYVDISADEVKSNTISKLTNERFISTLFGPLLAPSYLSLRKEMVPHKGIEIRNQCPKCAAECFHTDLFELRWVTQCPIHLTKLLEKCPECNKDWPKINSLFRRKCQTCGRLNLKNRKFLMPSTGNGQVIAAIGDIFEFISFGRPRNAWLISSVSVGYSPRRSAILIYDQRFPAFQFSRYPRPIKQALALVGVTDLEANFGDSVQDWVFTDTIPNKDIPVELSEIYEHCRLKSLNKIKQLIIKRTGENHCFTIYNLTHIQPIDILLENGPCPYCLALSYWYYAVVSIPESPHKHPGSKCLENLNWYLGAYTPPIPVDKLAIDGEIQALPKEFVACKYERDLIDNYFWLLNKLATGLVSFKAAFRQEQAAMPKHLQNIVSVDLDESVFFTYYNGNLHVKFRTKERLDINEIPNIPEAKSRCGEFNQYLVTKYLLPEVVFNNGDGITESQIEIFKKGYHFSRGQ